MITEIKKVGFSNTKRTCWEATTDTRGSFPKTVEFEGKTLFYGYKSLYSGGKIALYFESEERAERASNAACSAAFSDGDAYRHKRD